MTTLRSFATTTLTVSPAATLTQRLRATITALRIELARRRAAGLPQRLRYDIGETDLNPDKLRGWAAPSVPSIQAELSRMGF